MTAKSSRQPKADREIERTLVRWPSDDPRVMRFPLPFFQCPPECVSLMLRASAEREHQAAKDSQVPRETDDVTTGLIQRPDPTAVSG